MSPDIRNTTLAFRRKGRFAVIIPVFNHAQAVADVIRESLKLDFPVFVVDDGSTDSSYDKIIEINGIHPLHHKKNRGKGAAIMTGFAEAVKIADWAITIDADGQHHPPDALNLLAAIPENERPIIVGRRQGMIDRDVPWTSRFGRRFSNFWVWTSGGPGMTDSQSGFRIYPLPEAMNLNVIARRYQFEVEILVKAHWKKIHVIEAPVRVTYAMRSGRISHFHPLIDFVRNNNTFARLIVQRLFIPHRIRSKR